jgi:hypothetical protein
MDPKKGGHEEIVFEFLALMFGVRNAIHTFLENIMIPLIHMASVSMGAPIQYSINFSLLPSFLGTFHGRS